jgi:anti-anti-sigma factor
MTLKPPAAAHWDLILAKARLDSATHERMAALVSALRAQGRTRLAIDLKATRFISLAAIKFICATAHELRDQGGELAVVAASDKTMRHLEIYGTLAPLKLVKAVQSLTGPDGSAEVEIERHEIGVEAGALASTDSL